MQVFDFFTKMRYNTGMNIKNVVIVGGGASGMLCALKLAESKQFNVTLLERGERVGRKLSATGNGQGNISNVRFGAEHYFTDERVKLEKILNAFNNAALVSYFTSLGGLFESDDKGRIYPASRQASAVTDLLRFALERTGVKVITDCTAHKIWVKNEKFVIVSEKEETFFADVAVLACGGKAAKNFGTDGSGYGLASALGHSVSPLYPALVQLKTDTKYIKNLKGIRADCLMRAYDGEKEIAHARGDVIFTDYGVSGNAAFQLSSYLTDAKRPHISVEFLPNESEEKLSELLQNKLRFCTEDGVFGCILNNQIGRAVVKRVRDETGYFSPKDGAHAVKNFNLSVVGTLGFDYAQVTRGGIPMSEINANLESKKQKNLYLCGEILNVDGECGGYNLQWAFSSGAAVAKSIINREKERV